MDWLWIDPRGILECVRMFSHQGVAASTETWALYLEIEKKEKEKKKEKMKKIWRKTNILDNKIINWILVMILIIIILYCYIYICT